MVNPLKILTPPRPELEESVGVVTVFDEQLQHEADHMLDLMRSMKGVGLAGPQVGIMKQLLVAHPDEEGDAFIMCNPQIVAASDEMVNSLEGCLSLPGLLTEVPRHSWVDVKWWDAKGVEQEQHLETWEAVVVQHEMDHLNGITLLQGLNRNKRRAYLSDLRRYKKKIKKRVQR
jgi:peptide deformylase